ncbi:MAG: hypothetical protein IMW89_04385 [Ktedonobacteraceae bacterium]|nr:hypothetical protein [Ktedonobacteraceae bacterium]
MAFPENRSLNVAGTASTRCHYALHTPSAQPAPLLRVPQPEMSRIVAAFGFEGEHRDDPSSAQKLMKERGGTPVSIPPLLVTISSAFT